MSVQREEYIIYGCKFSEEFTREFWEKDFYDEYIWEKEKEEQPNFITDGMNGDYTFFGFIIQIGDGEEENYEAIEFKEITEENKTIIRNKFNELYPNTELPEIKMYYLPHYT